MGLLDVFDTIGGQQALGLLAAAGPRSDGAGFGQRLAEGLGAADQWKMRQAKMAQEAQQAKMQEMQMQQMQSQIAQQQKMQALAQQFARPGSPGLAPLMGDSETGILPSAGRSAVPPSFDYKGYANAMAGIDPMKALQIQQSLQKETPINKLDVKDFSPASVAKFAQTGNYGDLVRLDKAHFANTGGSTVAMDPFTGKPLGSIDNTQSPDSKASNFVTMRGQNMVDARAKEANGIQQQASRTQVMQTPEGLIAIDKGTNSATPVTMGGAPVRSEDAMKKGANAKTVLSLLDAADKLLPSSTGSTIGAGVDYLAGIGGKATKGATAIAQLKTIEGQLIGNMPRMEGPQSDADRMLYQQAAGDLANPMKPVSIRQAASKTIRELQQRYAGPSVGGGIDSLLDKYK